MTSRDAERERRRRAGRRRCGCGDGSVDHVDDVLGGPYTGAADDVVLRRNDGVPAYNLAVVVDDAAQGVDDVVRGDDLLPRRPRQVLPATAARPATGPYVHVPLVVGADGQRLAKRHGAVTLDDLAAEAVAAAPCSRALAASLGLPAGGAVTAASDLLAGFDLAPSRPSAGRRSSVADLQRSWS